LFVNWEESPGSSLRLKRYLSFFEFSLNLTDFVALFPPPKVSAITNGPLKGAEYKKKRGKKVALTYEAAFE
jgi:hypothetical protein